jgi:effector-binding domain-containing protein
MKALKYILIGLVCLVVIVGLLGLILPKDYTVERSAVINAPKPVLVNNIKSLKTMDQWSVWSKRDPNIKQEFKGTDGEVGSSNEWSGNDEVGQGKQEITGVTDNSVDIKLTFLKPWESQSNVNFMIADSADASKVTWTMHGKMPFPMNVFGRLFMNMDKMIGDDFEAGLAGLKKMSEENAAHKTYRGYEIKEINFEPRVYIAKRAMVKFADIGSFFQKNMPNFFSQATKAGLQPAGAPSGLYFSWDTLKHETDMAVAVAVAQGKPIPEIKGMQQVKAEGKALEIVYYGAYEKVGPAHDAMDDYIKEKGLEKNGLVIEEYMTDPMTEKDTAKWQTNIIYLVK